MLHQRSNISIVGHDMASMAPTVWLNDEVINLYMSLLLDRDTRRREAVRAAVHATLLLPPPLKTAC